MINYYEILEVSEKASKEVIEKAYKALAKKYHPDLNHDNPKDAETKMKQLNEALMFLAMILKGLILIISWLKKEIWKK